MFGAPPQRASHAHDALAPGGREQLPAAVVGRRSPRDREHLALVLLPIGRGARRRRRPSARSQRGASARSRRCAAAKP